MLQLTLLNGEACWFNPFLIATMEARPDTVLKLTNGEKWLVKESPQAVAEAFVRLQQTFHQPPTLVE